MGKFHIRLSYSNIMATIAVFVALGGTSYAALNLPRNSVKTKQIAPNAVRAKNLAQGAVTRAKIKHYAVGARQLAPGAIGPLGYAYIEGGNVDVSRSRNITTANVAISSDGFCFTNLPFQPRAIVATLGFDNFVPPNIVVQSRTVKAQLGQYQGCPSGSEARVQVQNQDGNSIVRANLTVVFY